MLYYYIICIFYLEKGYTGKQDRFLKCQTLDNDLLIQLKGLGRLLTLCYYLLNFAYIERLYNYLQERSIILFFYYIDQILS